ncbi:MAG: hypothetical protein ACJA2J_000275 [Candidatus Azotimanducaceae bacterium]|jgi:hypothetical protein
MRMTFIAALSLIGNLANADIDTSLVKEMEARAIGPAATSGKIAHREAVISGPSFIYAGTATWACGKPWTQV